MATEQNNLCEKCGNKIVPYYEKGIKIEPLLGVFTPFGVFTAKDLLILLKKRKVAVTKQCEGCKVIQIECPYCHNKTILDRVDLVFVCPHCCKKSYTYRRTHNIAFAISYIKNLIVDIRKKKKITLGKKDLIIIIIALLVIVAFICSLIIALL
jgi:hypothetical protein